MTRVSPIWIWLLLLSGTFTLATVVQPRLGSWEQADSGGVLKVLLGDSRQLVAERFLTHADVSFHSGFYPSIFDERRASKETSHMSGEEGHHSAEEHEEAMSFFAPPRDWIERFGRNFLITEHTHLKGGAEREILPWLKISAELDPRRVDTYTVAAYWLRNSIGRVAEAEQFLREGIRNNPQSYELWYELGQLYDENRHDLFRARNAWQLALRYWDQSEPSKADPDWIGWEKIVVRLANLEENAGNLDRAIDYLKMVLPHSPSPEALRGRISELQLRLSTGRATNSLSKVSQ